jgi:hypothetical protein
VARPIEHARQYAPKQGSAVDDTCIFIDDEISWRSLPTAPDSSA